MYRLNFIIALRNLWKHKNYTLLNLLGLSVAMACCVIIFIFIQFHLNFDEGYKNESRIYRFVTDWNYDGNEEYSKGVAIPHISAARNEISGLSKVTAIFKDKGVFSIKGPKGSSVPKIEETMYYVDPDFFEIFDIPWHSPRPGKKFSEPNTAILSKSMATNFFGNADQAINGSLLLGKNILKVVGVIEDLPENSSFPFRIIVSYETSNAKYDQSWDSVDSGKECYVLLNDGLTVDDIQQSLKAFNDKYYKKPNIPGNQTTKLQLLRDVHFDERYGSFSGKGITKKEIYALTLIGLFLMLTACINFINMTTAQAVKRSKEVGVRKVLGSQRSGLIAQFLIETTTIMFIAMLIACIIAELLLPGIRSFLGIHHAFGLFKYPAIFIFLPLLVIATAACAGCYPALIMSGFSPIQAIKNSVLINSSGLSLRKVLVVIQFGITNILIIATLVIIAQIDYMRTRPIGFDPEQVLMVNTPTDSLAKIRKKEFISKLSGMSGVKVLSSCTQAPMSDIYNTADLFINGDKNKSYEVRFLQSDPDYFDLFDLKIIAGKVYPKSDTINGYIVNETFLKTIGIKNPSDGIGKVVSVGKSMPVIGVVKDFNDQSLKEKISPLIIFQGNDYQKMAIKIDSEDYTKIGIEIERLWAETFPEGVYNGKFLNEDINKFYNNDQSVAVLFKVLSSIIILISFMGLFGLISFVASQRTKEIAIRKVLGASTIELIKMLNSSFLFMVFISSLLAWPFAYIFLKNWLSNFAYQIDLNILPFVWSMSISIVIAFITITFRSYHAAIANTISALKNE